MSNIDNFDSSTLSDFTLTASELERLSQSEYRDSIPEMEGFFSRLLNTITNQFQKFINALHQQVYSWEAMLTQNWQRYAERYISQLNNNLPESEAFTGTICLRGTRMTMEKNKAALIAVVNLTQRLDSAVLSTEKDTLSRDIKNVISYLEINGCTIDTGRPSASKSTTRFGYGEVGRLGTAGYGSEPGLFVSAMSRGVKDWYRVFEVLTDTKHVDQAVAKMEAEINRKATAMEKAKDSQKLELSQQINNMRARMVAYRSILRATIDMWKTTLVAHFILPLQNLGLRAGIKDDLTTWIFATKDD